ncbi:MAG: hypothetical protein PHR45_01595 [Muribaculaceae bacterium]|nr:hypothetical protein [Muribaculaceae bacterium]
MKNVILSLFALSAMYVNAQEVTVSKPVRLLAGVETEAYNPVLSADGSQMLFTGQRCKGLKVLTFADGATETISTAENAGYQAIFSNDGKVYFSIKEYEGAVGRSSLLSYDVNTKESSTIVEGQKKLSAPMALRNGVAVKTSKGLQKTTKDKGIYVYTEGSKVVVGNNGKENEYSPVESFAGYLWATLSPDNSKIAFFAAGKGIVVMSLDGKVISLLGNYEKPVWYGNNYIVAQNATDDGHQYSSSQILLLKADGSFKKELTTPTSMTMHPSASAQSGKIVYDTVDGRIYMMEITIKE